MEQLSSKEFTKYRGEMNKGCTDETLRPVATFNEEPAWYIPYFEFRLILLCLQRDYIQ